MTKLTPRSNRGTSDVEVFHSEWVGLSFTHGMDEAAQLQELKELIGHQTSVPEDMHAFIKSLAG